MKAQDLRIGNIVKWNSKQLTITCVNVDYCIGYESNKDELIHDNSTRPMFEGEQLTEEWLEKFGGEKDSDGIAFIYLNKEFDTRIYLHPELNHIIVTKGQYYNLDTLEHINTVHQLQNYYYIKTNQELTTNN